MNVLNALINLSKSVAIAPELTQGGGGNTSVKENGTMIIKASGFRLDEVSKNTGFVKVNHLPVKAFMQKATNELSQPDAELKQFVNDQIIGDKTFLPSMETGFHAVLKDYVIHTHPVVVNQILCSEKGEKVLEDIFKDETMTILPSLRPGYFLSKAVADVTDIAPVIFLRNHGLIVHADTEAEAITLHKRTIDKLNHNLKFESNFQFTLQEVADNFYELKTDLLAVYFSQQGLLSSSYFPDQAVVIGKAYQFLKNEAYTAKTNFDTQTRQCFIIGNYKNALAIAENLVALANIANYAKKKQLSLNALPEEDVAYILGMDMEKYRQSLLK